MATGSLPRGLAVLQCLVGVSEGLPLGRISELVDLPKSAAHRILVALADEGFVQQIEATGNYALTLRIVSLGLRHLAGSTIADLAVPVLARLARESQQLVRLGLVDGSRLMWVARSQGARGGLRYEPDVDHGKEIPLGSSASGLAWLSQLSDDEALHLVARQDPELRHPMGPGAPGSLTDVLDRVHEARARGWARVHDSFEEGISAMAAPLRTNGVGAAGVVSIAGPSLQLTDRRMDELADPLVAAAAELANLAGAMVSEVRTQDAASSSAARR
ncbi:IclR family transcriptional regulator [Mycobacterium sp. NPDC006124]|uniref:IclR family transcriptional regulator n=1 Tax=Mycobacterium sp. NPDC006124 TaxID=3156729 RepID=UPI0033B4F06A